MPWCPITTTLVRRYVARAPRDPESGVLRGAEARTLGPEDAACALLCVHGFAGCPNNLHDLPDQVAAAGWRVRAMLLPGHGTTPFEFEAATADQLIDAVRDELAALRERHETVVILGHSLGGALSTLVAAEALPDGLVLAAPFFAVRHRWYYLMRPEQWARTATPAIRWIPSPAGIEPVRRKEVAQEILSYEWTSTRAACTAIEVCEHAREPDVLARITCPVLLLHSRQDGVTDPKAAATAVEAMGSTDKQMTWFEASDHIIFWDHDRAAVTAATLSFLQRVAAH